MKSRALIAMLVLLVGLTAMPGCSSDNNEHQRVVCEVLSINGGSPVVAAALNIGADASNTNDDYVPIDIVPVTFRARTYSNSVIIPEDDTYSWFHVTSYTMTWTPGAGAPPELTTYNVTDGPTDVLVPVGEEGVVGILVADAGMKAEPWFQDLLTGARTPWTANLSFQFRGHESGSEHEVVIPAGVVVTFVGAVSDKQ